MTDRFSQAGSPQLPPGPGNGPEPGLSGLAGRARQGRKAVAAVTPFAPPDPPGWRPRLLMPAALWSLAGMLAAAILYPFLEPFLEAAGEIPGARRETATAFILGYTIVVQGLFAGAILATLRRARIPASRLGIDRWHRDYLSVAGRAFLLLLPATLFIQAVQDALAGSPLPPQEIALFLMEPAGPGYFIFFVLSAGLAIPLLEEIIFRGFLFGILKTAFGPGRSILYTSLLFAGLHASAGAFLPLALMGAAFAWLFQKTGSLWPAICLHALNNTFYIIFYYFAGRLMPGPA